MNKPTWTIYKHTNKINNKSYIGLTKRRVEDRWRQHINTIGSSKMCCFHYAIQKHGVDSWTTTILHSNIPTLREANKLEKYYIEKYSTFTNGYNATTGGDGTENSFNKLTDTQKESRISNILSSRKNKKYTIYNPTLDALEENVYVYEVAKKYNIDSKSLQRVVSGAIYQAYGWYLWEGTDKEYTPQNRDNRVISIEHPSYGVETGTVTELSARLKLRHGALHKVSTGCAVSTKGWTLKGNQKLLGTSRRKVNKMVAKIDMHTMEVVDYYLSINKAAVCNNTTRKVITNRVNKEELVEFDGHYYRYIQQVKI